MNWPNSSPSFTLLLESVLMLESSGCTQLRGIDKRAYGCMQIHLKTAESITRMPLSPWVLTRDPALNIRIAADLLRRYYRETHSWRRMLSMYHDGPGFRGIDTEYVRAVLRRIRSLPLSVD